MAKYKIIPSSRTIVQSPISIGHKAEKGVEAIEFDVTAWVETYGSGTLTVIMRRWGDAIPYPIALEIDENNKATWTLSDTDTAKAGMAYAQLSYIVGDEVVKKSDIYTFRVMDSLTGEGEPPEAYESWLEHLTHLAAEAMAEVLDIEGIVTDKTLKIDGGIADAKSTGDALTLKADKSTTYTKTEVDTLIDEVEVETDTTLAISGAPADAKKVGDELSDIKADLGAQSELIESPTGERFVSFVLGNITYSSGNITYSSSTSRVCTREGYTVHLKKGDRVGLKDHVGKRYWPMWKAVGASTWSRAGAWQYADYTISTEGDYAFLIAEDPDATQESAEALASLFFLVVADSYQTALTDELPRKSLVSNNMDYNGYIGSDGITITGDSTSKKCRYTEWIPVEAGKTYAVDYRCNCGSASAWWYCVIFYDASKAMVGTRLSYTNPSVDEFGYYFVKKVYTIPEGTAYMRLTARTYGDCYTCVYEYVSAVSDIRVPLNRMMVKIREERDAAIAEAIPDFASMTSYPVVYSPIKYDYVCKGINHRGMYGYPENTIAAFKGSIAEGFYFVETDICFTSDNVPVLLHDGTINRTARNADGTELSETVNISSITLEQAKTYDFGIYKGEQFAGEKIPTLEEFLIFCKRACLHPYLEIKFTPTTEKIHAVVDMVHRCGLRDRSTYICTNVNALAMIVAYDRKARVGAIYGLSPTAANAAETATLKTGSNEVICCPRRPNSEIVEACIANRVTLEIWDYDIASSAILQRSNMCTGIVHGNLHAGKLIYNDANGIVE